MLNKRQKERWSKLRQVLISQKMSEAEVQTIILLCESEVQLAIAEAVEVNKHTSSDYRENSVQLAAAASLIISALDNIESASKRDIN